MLDHTFDTAAPRAAPRGSRVRWITFAVIAVIASAVMAWLLRTSTPGFNGPAGGLSLALLFACTVALLWANPNPIPAQTEDTPLKKGRFVLLLLAVSVPLFTLPVLFRSWLMVGLIVLALLALVWLRRSIHRRELLYALALALVSTIAGLSAGWIRDVSPVVWGIIQFPLVLTSFLAGWKILQSHGLLQSRVGYSRFLNEGWRSALRAFGLGLLIGVPWALGNILLGGSRDTWVNAWWKPLIAIQPGIAEEAWGRVLLVSLLFLVFRLAARPRVAFAAALILAAYWFSYLHTPMGIDGLISTVLLGTLYGLPISYLTLYRDLETGIGTHFFIDFVRFLSALLG